MQTRSATDDARARAFAGLVDRRALDGAYRYATLILGDRAEAEDATHDAALNAWRRFGELRDLDRFDAWFGRILVNVCRDRLRGRSRAIRVIQPDDSTRFAPDPADVVGRQQALADALATLSVEHREAVVLRYFADLTVDQIADRTGASAGTVKSRLHYALRHLREAIAFEGDDR